LGNLNGCCGGGGCETLIEEVLKKGKVKKGFLLPELTDCECFSFIMGLFPVKASPPTLFRLVFLT
jgi:hypothetical protein